MNGAQEDITISKNGNYEMDKHLILTSGQLIFKDHITRFSFSVFPHQTANACLFDIVDPGSDFFAVLNLIQT
jgi:hypothetical protein